MLRNSTGGVPDVPWEDADEPESQIEIIEVQPDEILCAFVLECPEALRERATRYWKDTIVHEAAGSMMKFLRNHGD